MFATDAAEGPVLVGNVGARNRSSRGRASVTSRA
jgi:hypothetical protein